MHRGTASKQEKVCGGDVLFIDGETRLSGSWARGRAS